MLDAMYLNAYVALPMMKLASEALELLSEMLPWVWNVMLDELSLLLSCCPVFPWTSVEFAFLNDLPMMKKFWGLEVGLNIWICLRDLDMLEGFGYAVFFVFWWFCEAWPMMNTFLRLRSWLAQVWTWLCLRDFVCRLLFDSMVVQFMCLYVQFMCLGKLCCG